ncbi:MAG: cytochrome b [Gallionellaceae bacterium]|jgi:cytochrome b561|nr:cytochrome b [Gallionellaceae bacterium]
MSNQTVYYSAPRRLLHWIVAVLLIAGLVAVESHEIFPKENPLRGGLVSLHFQVGLLVFLLVWPRLALALSGSKPPVNPPLVPWQATLSTLTHVLLYAAMVVMPVLGLLAVQMNGNPVTLLGWELPAFTGVDKDLSRTIRGIHETIGNVVIGLLVLHIAAAVWHHRFLKDDTMVRMLPPKK